MSSKIIDAHLHFSNIHSFKQTAEELSILDYSGAGLKKEFAESNIVLGIGMGITETNQGGFPDSASLNPMGLDLEETVPEFILSCVGINPLRLKGGKRDQELDKIEEELQTNSHNVGIKIYAGYYPFYVHDQIYEPIYRLAAKYQLPVVIHSGDTYSERGLLKYSHPLTIDELAVAHRDVNFVVAHFGDPWIMETAEIVAKNRNVFADLSGLIVGDEEQVQRFRGKRLFMDHIERGPVYADCYDKLLFGSDWPLVAIKPYIEFVQEIIPEEFHEDVFYRNALKVFPKLKEFLPEE